ncbi:hypothetical protein ACVWZ7_003088 [Arthrobacter sp. TE12232]
MGTETTLPGSKRPDDNEVLRHGSGVISANAQKAQQDNYLVQLLDPLRHNLLSRTRPMPSGKCFLRRTSKYKYWMGYQLDPLRWMVHTFSNSPNADGGAEARQLVQLNNFAAYRASLYTNWDEAGWTWNGASWEDSAPLAGRRAATRSEYARFTLPLGSRAALLRFTAHSSNGIAEVRMVDDLGATHTPFDLLSGRAMLEARLVTQGDIDAENIRSSAYYVNQHTYGASSVTDVVLSTNLDAQRTYTVTVLGTGVQRAGSIPINLVGSSSAEVEFSGCAATRAAVSKGAGGTPAQGNAYFRLTVTDSAAGIHNQRVDITPRITVIPGVAYTMSAYLRAAGIVGVSLQMVFFDSGGAVVGNSSYSPTITGSTFVRTSVTATPPAGTVSMLLRIGNTNATDVGSTMDFYGVMLDQSDTLRSCPEGAPGPHMTVAAIGRDHPTPNSQTTWVLDEQLGGSGTRDPSAWEYALGVDIGGTDSYIGNQHGYDRPTSWTVYADAKTLTPPVGSIYTSNGFTIERLSDLYHPGSASKVGTARVVYSMSAAGGLHVDRKITWVTDGWYYNPYMVMWPTTLERVSWVGANQTWTADQNIGKAPAGQLGKLPYQLCYAWNAAGNYVALCDSGLEGFRSFAWGTAYAYYEDRSATLKKLYVAPITDGVRRRFVAGDTMQAASTYAAGRVSSPEATLKR